MTKKKKLGIDILHYDDCYTGYDNFRPQRVLSTLNRTIRINTKRITINTDAYIEIHDMLSSKYELIPINNNIIDDKKKPTPFDDDEEFFFINEDETLIVYLSNNFSELHVHLHYVDKYENIVFFYQDILKIKNKYKSDERVYVVTEGKNDQLTLCPFEVKKPDIDFDTYYNEDFSYEKFKSSLSDKDKNGIILLSGVAGSGKTNLIRYLIHDMEDSKFVYLPTNYIEIFASSKHFPFLVKEFDKKIIIVEDCETILKSRSDNNQDMSTILNISDGIMSDYLNVKLIFTINTRDSIDSALLRKGRNLFTYNFEALKPERANKVATKIGLNKTYTEDIPLTDIFNDSNEDAHEKLNKSNKKKIGF